MKDGTDNSSYNFPSFRISEIANGKVTGSIAQSFPAVPNYYYYNLPNRYGFLTGTMDNSIVKCQFSDENGNKGNIKLFFKSEDEIEGIIQYREKSQNNEHCHEGTFQFRPYNISEYKKDINIIKDKSFTVDLNY